MMQLPKGPYRPFMALAQGVGDYSVQVVPMKLEARYSASPVMVVMATGEAIYISKEQAMAFFGLAESEPVAWKADNGHWAATKADAEAYEKRMGVRMYPLYKHRGE